MLLHMAVGHVDEQEVAGHWTLLLVVNLVGKGQLDSVSYVALALAKAGNERLEHRNLET